MNLSSEQYSETINLLKHAILATDLSVHIQYVTIQFNGLCCCCYLDRFFTLFTMQVSCGLNQGLCCIC